MPEQRKGSIFWPAYRTGRLLFFLAATAALAAFLPPLGIFSVGIAVLAVFLLARRLDIGLAILVAIFPYLGIVIDLSRSDMVRDVPFLNQLNAPLVDIFGLLLFAAWFAKVAQRILTVRFREGKPVRLSAILGFFPHWKSFGAFLLSAAISLKNVPTNFFNASVKYLARPVAFFYFAFFVPTVSIIKKYGEGYLRQLLWIFYGTGLASALMGVVSFFAVPPAGFPRATPFAIFGIAPLGVNHNLLAETLVATAPVGFLLWRRSGKLSVLFGSLLQVVIALLTFARTAWIALAAEAAVLVLWWGWQQGKRLRAGEFMMRFRRALPIAVSAGILLIPLAAYMGWTLFSEVVQSSTLTRLDMARIAWFYFLREPWFGQGVGTFIPTLWGVKAFLLDYGEPLEAHGIVWKLMFEQGIAGLAAYAVFSLSIVAGIARGLFKKRAEPLSKDAQGLLLCALVLVVGSFTYQLFNTTYYTSKLWVPVGIAVGAAGLYKKK